MDSGNLLWRMRNEIGRFLPYSLINPNFQKWPYFIHYYGFATITHGCKAYFSFATMTDGCIKVIFIEFFNNINIFCETFQQMVSKNAVFMWKSHEISLFATVSHGCKGKIILCNHDSWLQRIFFSLQPWLAVAKRQISWHFPIIYIYKNELTSENMYLPMNMAKKSQFHFSFFKVDSQNPKFNLEYL